MALGALVALVVVMQFAFVQHSIAHADAFPEPGCEVCVGGVHHASAPSASAVVPDPLTLHAPRAAGLAETPASDFLTPLQPRAPPARV